MKLCKLLAISLCSLRKRDEEGEGMSLTLLQMLLHPEMQVVKNIDYFYPHAPVSC